MQQIMSTPAQTRVRRMGQASPVPPCPATTSPSDPRWSLLDLVRTCRKALQLRDRDVAVLRGLLSLVPASAEPEARIVFASNRVLIERCDGIDERTLRRRLDHLGKQGLLRRRMSPNGKRYRVRDTGETVALTYGIDLAPLFALRDHLEALAEQVRQDAIRCKALRAVIRDVLYWHSDALPVDLVETANRALRRVLTADALQEIAEELRSEAQIASGPHHSETREMTVSDSQNDRHNQSSYKENLDSEEAGEVRDMAECEQTAADASNDITVQECIELSPNAQSLAPCPARSWEDVIVLSASLAPAIGLKREDVDRAQSAMGRHGCALAVLGMIESFVRIRNPRAYLHALSKRASEGGLDAVRMFRSLTKSGAASSAGSFAA